MSWPGIPEGRGSTCCEDGCGNERRAGGWDCRTCYRRKWTQDRRVRGLLNDGAGGYEVQLSSSVLSELEQSQYQSWRTARDEYT